MTAIVAAGCAATFALFALREPMVSLTQENLDNARHKWREAAVSDYVLVMLVHGGEYEVRVAAGRVVSLTRDGASANSYRPEDYAVTGIFDTLERELELVSRPDNPLGGDATTTLMRVRYHPRWGFVERYLRAVGGTGRSETIEVSSFTPGAVDADTHVSSTNQ